MNYPAHIGFSTRVRSFALDAFLCLSGSAVLAIVACWIVIATSGPRYAALDPLPALRWEDVR